MSGSPQCYIGVMTGNSMDAADAVLMDFSAEPSGAPAAAHTARVLRSAHAPLPAPLREQLRALSSGAPIAVDMLLAAQNELTDACAAAVAQLQAAPDEVRAIGCHGQTIAHRPAAAASWQILNGARLAERTGMDVICDFRARDIASGGQGAPFAPFFHQHFFAAHAPCDVINIGGIANLTRLNAAGELECAYDTGPGMVLMDAWMQRHGSAAYDDDGAFARQGAVDDALLQRLLAHPYLALPPPKSCGREEFSLALLPDNALPPPPAVQATLLEFTAQTIAAEVCKGRDKEQPATVFLSGGGSRNGALRARLAELLPAPPRLTADAGLDGQLVEAAAFAYLAKCFMERQPLAAAAVTGGATRLAGAHYPR